MRLWLISRHVLANEVVVWVSFDYLIIYSKFMGWRAIIPRELSLAVDVVQTMTFVLISTFES